MFHNYKNLVQSVARVTFKLPNPINIPAGTNLFMADNSIYHQVSQPLRSSIFDMYTVDLYPTEQTMQQYQQDDYWSSLLDMNGTGVVNIEGNCIINSVYIEVPLFKPEYWNKRGPLKKTIVKHLKNVFIEIANVLKVDIDTVMVDIAYNDLGYNYRLNEI